jgi:iron complex outermembrane receptor protein
MTIAGMAALLAGAFVANVPWHVAAGAEVGTQTTSNSEGPSALEDVIVTAERREQRLQDAPVSVTAFNAGDIEERSIRTLSDVAAFTPNLSISNGSIAGSDSAQVYIRGIGQYDFASAADPGVGIYVDGVYLGRSVGSMLDLADVDRVEVLRGPQGTLYGKNTIGGAINVVTAAPLTELGGDAQVTGGSYDRADFKGTVNVPLSGNDLLSSLTVLSHNSNGYGDRPLVAQTMGNISTQGARAVLEWRGSESVTVRFDADGTHTRDHGPVRSLLATEQTPFLQFYNAYFGPYGNQYLTGNPYVSLGTGPNYNDLDQYGAALHVDWKLDGATFKSISSFRQLKAAWAADVDNSPQYVAEEADVMKQHQFTQEFQLTGKSFNDRLDWMTGLYYFRERALMTFDVSIMPAFFYKLGLDLSEVLPDAILTNSSAAYAHVTYALTDRLSVIGGLRYTYETKDFVVGAYSPLSGQVIVPQTPLSNSWSNTSPMLGFQYKLTPDVMTYLSASEGFKSGGFNARPTVVGEVKPFNPETVTTYELGVKSEWFDHRLRANADVFYNDYKDVQVTIITGSGTTILSYIDNAARAKGQGAEFELTARPASPLTLGLALGYIDARYTETNPGSTITLSSQFVETPKWSATATAEYSIPLANGSSLKAAADYTYKSATYLDPGNTAQLTQGDVGLVNARLTFVPSHGAWQASIFGTNLGNKVYLSAAGASVLSTLGLVEGQIAPPREWGATVEMKF